MTSIQKNSPSLCIPRAFGNITKKRVMEVMKECKFGMVERIDEISKVNEKGETVKRFFVHFKHWFKGWDAERQRLMSGDSERLKIVYDDPWYWMVKASDPAAAHKPRENGGKRLQRRSSSVVTKFPRQLQWMLHTPRPHHQAQKRKRQHQCQLTT